MDINTLHQYFLSSTGACTDTRKIKIDDMFFALKGDNFNGNEYAEKAIDLGAKYVVIDEASYNTDEKCIVVDDVLKTLQDLSKYHREKLETPIIALTGSNGKTTTKELINAVLSKKYNTIATIGNLNNHIGVPLTLLRITKETELAIVEMGANHLKEIEFLCSIATPDYGLITNFGKAHLEGFGSEEGVVQGKSELYQYLVDNDKVIIANTEDARQMEVIQNYKGVDTDEYSSLEENISLLSAKNTLKIDYDGDIFETKISGAYNFTNIKYAVAIGEHFDVAKKHIIEAIENYTPDNNRSQIIERDTNIIVLDAYNANPSSMLAALESFHHKSGKRKIAILGDMFELGTTTAEEHQNIADTASLKNIDNIYLVGKNFYKITSSHPTLQKFETFEDLEQFLESENLTESVILVKGSRGMALERVLEFI